MLSFSVFSSFQGSLLTGFAVSDSAIVFTETNSSGEDSSSLDSEIIYFGPNISSSLASDPQLSSLRSDIIERLNRYGKSEVIIVPKPGSKFKSSLDASKIIEEFSSGGIVAELSPDDFKVLLRDKSIESLEPINYFNTSLQDSTGLVSASTAWNLKVNGTNLTGLGRSICVVDTGIDFSHPDLINKNVVGCNVYCTAFPCNVNCSATDLNGHGTHVAGIAAASGGVSGIAPGARLVGVKVFSGSAGTGASTAAIVRGINWCTTNAEIYNISVITISISSATLYSTGCDSFFASIRNAVNLAFIKNISVTASTGNNANPTKISSPACLHNVTAVSATNKDDSPAVSYANFARNIQWLVAPGTTINSTCVSGGYCIQTGTSMSTPMVAGALALISDVLNRTNQRPLSPAQLELLLNRTGDLVLHPNGSFRRINIHRALLTLDVIAPLVNQSYPPHLYQNALSEQVFSCNATDWQLSHVGMALYRPGLPGPNKLIFNATASVSGDFASVNFTVTNLSAAKYIWWCSANDSLNYTSLSANFTFIVGGIRSILSSPSDGALLYEEPIPFYCNATTSEGIDVLDGTLFIWENKSSEIAFTETQPASSNSTSAYFDFEVSGLEDGPYIWNCLVRSTIGDSAFSTFNRSFFVDRTAPNVTLLYPFDEVAFTTSQMPLWFGFEVVDDSTPFCQLLIDDEPLNSSYATMNGTSSFNMSLTFSAGAYVWAINCTDALGNFYLSESRSFDVSVDSSTGSDGGGGGGGGGSGGGGGGGGFTVVPHTNDSSESNDSSSYSGNYSNDVPFSEPEPGGGVVTGRVVEGPFTGDVLWWLWAILFILVIFFVYRYLRNHFNRTSALGSPTSRRRHIPISIRDS